VPLQAPHALRDPVCTPRGSAHLLEAQLWVVMGRVHAPASSPYALGQGSLLNPGLDRHTRRAAGLSRTLTVAAFRLVGHDGMNPYLSYIDDAIAGDDRCDGLQRFGGGGEPLLARLACIECIALINPTFKGPG
jgi:hypothetical protein